MIKHKLYENGSPPMGRLNYNNNESKNKNKLINTLTGLLLEKVINITCNEPSLHNMVYALNKLPINLLIILFIILYTLQLLICL